MANPTEAAEIMGRYMTVPEDPAILQEQVEADCTPGTTPFASDTVPFKEARRALNKTGAPDSVYANALDEPYKDFWRRVT